MLKVPSQNLITTNKDIESEVLINNESSKAYLDLLRNHLGALLGTPIPIKQKLEPQRCLALHENYNRLV